MKNTSRLKKEKSAIVKIKLNYGKQKGGEIKEVNKKNLVDIETCSIDIEVTMYVKPTQFIWNNKS